MRSPVTTPRSVRVAQPLPTLAAAASATPSVLTLTCPGKRGAVCGRHLNFVPQQSSSILRCNGASCHLAEEEKGTTRDIARDEPRYSCTTCDVDFCLQCARSLALATHSVPDDNGDPSSQGGGRGGTAGGSRSPGESSSRNSLSGRCSSGSSPPWSSSQSGSGKGGSGGGAAVEAGHQAGQSTDTSVQDKLAMNARVRDELGVREHESTESLKARLEEARALAKPGQVLFMCGTHRPISMITCLVL